jgi:hypothetical protein
MTAACLSRMVRRDRFQSFPQGPEAEPATEPIIIASTASANLAAVRNDPAEKTSRPTHRLYRPEDEVTNSCK